jgi:hypothetical protein
MKETSQLLQNELDNYINGDAEFSEYYPGMNILVSNLYKSQLQELLESLDSQVANSFKLYLDTVIINMQTKAKKYKQSVYFENENINIKDIENQGYTIPFYADEAKNIFVILGLVKTIQS